MLLSPRIMSLCIRSSTIRPNSQSSVQLRRTVANATGPLAPRSANPESKQKLVDRLLDAKEKSGKTFSQIASEVGYTNLYTAGLFYNQQQLKPGGVEALKKAVPALDEGTIAEMMRPPNRRFDPDLIQDPAVYRLYEAVMHNGEALKAIINEEAGDGIMSAIDIYAAVDTVTGKHGEKRIVVTLNGKYLPYVEAKTEDNVAQRS